MLLEQTCIVYSSRTGNTEKVATALANAFMVPLFPVKTSPSLSSYTTVILGFWVRRALPDEDMLQFMETVQNKNVFFFCTHAAWPDSDHIRKCCTYVREHLENMHNRVLGCFSCQGSIQKLGKIHHAMTDERRARLEEAAHHPDTNDFLHAVLAVQDALSVKTNSGQLLMPTDTMGK